MIKIPISRQTDNTDQILGKRRSQPLDRIDSPARFLKSVKHILEEALDFYHHVQTHLSLNRAPPIARDVEPLSRGKVIAVPHVGGHRQYKQRLPPFYQPTSRKLSQPYGPGSVATSRALYII